MTQAGDDAPVPEPSPEIGPILAGLGGEIHRPLESLQGRIDKLLADPSSTITDAERAQARTMLDLCDDLGRLTRECLGRAGMPGDGPD